MIIDFGEPFNNSIFNTYYLNIDLFDKNVFYHKLFGVNKIIHLPGLFLVFINSNSSSLEKDIALIN